MGTSVSPSIPTSLSERSPMSAIRNAQISSEPIAYQLWVGFYQNQGDATNPSGSGTNAYSTLVAAVSFASSLPRGSDITFHLTKRDYTGEGAIDLSVMDGQFVNFVSEVAASAIGSFTGVCTTGVVLTLRDIGCGGITCTKVDIRAFNCPSLENVILLQGSAVLDHSNTGNMACPDGGLTVINSSLIEGNVTAGFIERAADSTFGSGGEDPLTFALDHTQDDARGFFKNCNFLSAYSYQNGTGEFNADDISTARFIASFSGGVVGTVFNRYDFKSESYTPVLTSVDGNATIGDGSISADILQEGDTVWLSITMNTVSTGTATNFGTGNSRLSLPPDFKYTGSPSGSLTSLCQIASPGLAVGQVVPCGGVGGGAYIEFNDNFGISFAFPIPGVIYFQTKIYANRVSPP